MGTPQIYVYGRQDIDHEAKLYEEASDLADEWLKDFEVVAETYDSRLLPESLARMASTAATTNPKTAEQRNYHAQLCQAIGEALVEDITRLAYEDAIEEIRERARA